MAPAVAGSGGGGGVIASVEEFVKKSRATRALRRALAITMLVVATFSRLDLELSAHAPLVRVGLADI